MHKYFLLFLFLFSRVLIAQPICGAKQTQRYLPFLKNKDVALVVNQTSLIDSTHLVDSLLHLGIKIKTIFAPEHGFRGDHGAGVSVKTEKDERTGLPIVSLYGRHKKPTAEDLKGVGIVVFDIQDVGARFYTYISTMHYVMEACAENGIPFLVLDRPNPHGYYIDGPVLDTAYSSFVGMHPVPVVHGMTIGEYAQMINGEAWLKNGVRCDLAVIDMKNYGHNMRYSLPVRPSPNLPNDIAISLYPSLCFFEGTDVSVGRGTPYPFQMIGRPAFKGGDTSFTPKAIPGVAENPPHKNRECHGFSFTSAEDTAGFSGRLNLKYLILFYGKSAGSDEYFNNFFDKLAGTGLLRQQIIKGLNEEEIRESWQHELRAFKKVRSRYLLYKDFE